MPTRDPKTLVTALNLYILQIIADLASEDLSDAILRFAITPQIAQELAELNPAEIFEISQSPHLLFSVDEEALRGALVDFHTGRGNESMRRIIKKASLLQEQRK